MSAPVSVRAPVPGREKRTARRVRRSDPHLPRPALFEPVRVLQDLFALLDLAVDTRRRVAATAAAPRGCLRLRLAVGAVCGRRSGGRVAGNGVQGDVRVRERYALLSRLGVERQGPVISTSSINPYP